MKMKIYVAHPITGLSGDDVIKYFDGMKLLLEPVGYDVLQPMTAKGYFRTEKEFKSNGYTGRPVSSNHAIIERDNWMVSMADVVFVDLTGAQSVSIGCIMELAWAHQLRKHSVVVMEDDNIHKHAFVLEAADIVFSQFSDSIEYLKKLAEQEF